MGPEVRAQLKWFRIGKTENKQDVKIIYGRKGEENYYDNFTGIIKSIDYTEKEVDFQKNGKPEMVKQYTVKFDAGDTVEHVWAVDVDSNLFLNFINSIAGLADIAQPVNMSVYQKNGYANIWLKSNGQDLRWKYPIDVIPKPAQITVDGEVIMNEKTGKPQLSYKKRREWVAELVKNINSRIRAVETEGYEPVIEEVEEVSF
ncbi:MAG: hypothetical protein KF896_14255 [Ignavibacteriae bacterium]|nr:hypothetical protein [Ignavibacteriota bacterium]